MKDKNKKVEARPDKFGHFGEFGGRYVPDTLMSALLQLEAEYKKIKRDKQFQSELNALLKEYAGTYLTTLKARVAESAKLWSEVADDFDSRALLEQMNRDELYAVLALDYFKKLLGRNPVMDSHPF